LARGRASQVPSVTPTFTIVDLTMWPYGRQNRQKIAIFGIHLPLKKSRGFIGKLEYRCTTRNLHLCNGAIIVLKITLLHGVFVIANFVISKREKQTKNYKAICITSMGQCNIGRPLERF